MDSDEDDVICTDDIHEEETERNNEEERRGREAAPRRAGRIADGPRRYTRSGAAAPQLGNI